MFIFANPLGIPELDNAATLVHPDATLAKFEAGLKMAYRLIRMTKKDGERVFYGYRLTADIERGHPLTDLKNPFPTPLSRSTAIQSRGRFRLQIEPL